jgi:hypothetical protein
MKLILILIAAVCIMIIWSVIYTERKRTKKEANPDYDIGDIVAVDTGDAMFVAQVVAVMDYSVQVRSRQGRLAAYPKSCIRKASGEQIRRFNYDQV